ncbi:MAG: hypothetical protein KBE26_08555, partial [Bacteroidales bacterium]|nr:hypothetical protein [Bacteroidales bacterium]
MKTFLSILTILFAVPLMSQNTFSYKTANSQEWRDTFLHRLNRGFTEIFTGFVGKFYFFPYYRSTFAKT